MGHLYGARLLGTTPSPNLDPTVCENGLGGSQQDPARPQHDHLDHFPGQRRHGGPAKAYPTSQHSGGVQCKATHMDSTIRPLRRHHRVDAWVMIAA